MDWRKVSFIICIVLIIVTACSQNNKKGQADEDIELTVSAAASLTDAMEEIISLYEAKYSNINVSLNLGSSGSLKQQISQGAPTDLFISAAEDQFDYLNEQQMIDQTYQETLLQNQLVVIKKKETLKQVQQLVDIDMESVKQVAIGMPTSVPAGKYAKQALEYVNMYQQLEDKLVFTKDVRQALHYVESGSVSIGFVYQTDMIKSNQVEAIATLEQGWHDPINYPIGIIKDTPHKEAAITFYQFLHEERIINIFEKNGFTIAGR